MGLTARMCSKVLRMSSTIEGNFNGEKLEQVSLASLRQVVPSLNSASDEAKWDRQDG